VQTNALGGIDLGQQLHGCIAQGHRCLRDFNPEMNHHGKRLATSIISRILAAQEAVTELPDIGSRGSRSLLCRDSV
jgi:hypothetical protein